MELCGGLPYKCDRNMKDKHEYKIMLAEDGGMTISDEGRYVFMNDSDMAMEMGEWILEVLKNASVADAMIANCAALCISRGVLTKINI